MLKKKTRLRKEKASSFQKRCDILFSKITRSKGVCELKGLDKIKCAGELQTMHIVTRGNKRLRFDPMNVICGCQGHHLYYTYRNWEWVKIIEKHFADKAAYIEEHREEPALRKINDWRELEAYLKTQL